MTVTVDEKTKKKAVGHNRIDLSQPYELGYWSRKFGVSEQELADAVHLLTTGSHSEWEPARQSLRSASHN